MNIIIAGANGFIARYLTRYFSQQGHTVKGLARHKTGMAEECKFVLWDGETLGDWAKEIDGADVVINLTGRTVNCRYNEENKRQIIDSRVHSTRVIGEAIAACQKPPEVWMNASTATIYRSAQDKPQGDHTGEIGSGFSVDVATAWEDAFFSANVPGQVRKLALRTSMVMEDEPGTVYRYLRNLAKFGLGGKIGTGKQMVSWIHMTDVCRAIDWLIEHDEISGPINITAPDPVSNAELMRRFRKFVSMPFGLPATKWMAEIGAFFLRTETELILKSRWVVPTRLLEHGFVFQYPELDLDKFQEGE
ncbi:MAG: TIGR01777 family oxidoreductase [Akkermansiaceae bacterium]